MSHKKSKMDVSRRSFLQRSALLVGGLGVTASVQSGLLDSIARRAKRTFGTAMAQANPGIVDFHIEISSRLGLQLNALFASPSHTLPIGTGAGQRFGNDQLNFYWTPNMIQQVPVSGTNRSVYLARVDGFGNVGNNPLAAYADRIAYSEAVSDGPGGFFPHTDKWKTRFPSMEASPPPVVHAFHTPFDVPIRGIRLGIPEGFLGVSHEGRSLPSMDASVADDVGLVNLYKDVPLPFTYDELKTIVGSFDDAGTLVSDGLQQKLDSVWRSTVNMKGNRNDDEPTKLVNGGRNMSTLQYDLRLDGNPTPTLPTNTISTDPVLVRNMFGYDDDALINLGQFSGQVHLGRTFFHTWQAMGLGLARTMAIDINSDDWHSDRPADDAAAMMAKQGLWANALARVLANFLDFASNTPNPLPGRTGTIADSLLISMTSEFTRTPFNNNNSDNGDGYTQGFCFIGSRVNGGVYGDIDTHTRPLPLDDNGITTYGSNRVISFDPVSGELAPGTARMLPGDVWKTQMQLLGLTEADYAGHNVDGTPIDCVIDA